MGVRKKDFLPTTEETRSSLDIVQTPPPSQIDGPATILFDHGTQRSEKHTVASILVGLAGLARPKHWLKNSFVLAPLLCYPPTWTATNLFCIFTAFGCFCLWSSSVYAFNDTVDRHRDALHPRKCKRPIPSGAVSPTLAVLFSLFLSIAAIGAAHHLLSPAFLLVGMLYLANNLAYCLNLRNQVILDVMSIAAGFVLRIFGGCLAVGIMPSNWMIVCGFSLALLLGFGKRRLELGRTLENQNDCRKTLDSYPVEFLNILLGVSSMMCLTAYMLYTIAPETAAIHGTPYLIYSTPFVVYGVFRYSIRCIQGSGDGPVDVLTQDKAFMVNTAAWLGCVGLILFLS